MLALLLCIFTPLERDNTDSDRLFKENQSPRPTRPSPTTNLLRLRLRPAERASPAGCAATAATAEAVFPKAKHVAEANPDRCSSSSSAGEVKHETNAADSPSQPRGRSRST